MLGRHSVRSAWQPGARQLASWNPPSRAIRKGKQRPNATLAAGVRVSCYSAVVINCAEASNRTLWAWLRRFLTPNKYDQNYSQLVKSQWLQKKMMGSICLSRSRKWNQKIKKKLTETVPVTTDGSQSVQVGKYPWKTSAPSNNVSLFWKTNKNLLIRVARHLQGRAQTQRTVFLQRCVS